MKVHPVADLFPMLPDDELADLAADIKANGLQSPIVVKDKVLIDGRNRLAACEMAGVEPEYVEMNGSDPVAFILSANLARRHMSKGQRAMAAARVYTEYTDAIGADLCNYIEGVFYRLHVDGPLVCRTCFKEYQR